MQLVLSNYVARSGDGMEFCMKVKHMTFLAMYTTIALTIFVVEAMLPPLAPIPGIKLGLANVVTLWLLYYATWKDALCVLLMRILIASTSFSRSMSTGITFSLCDSRKNSSRSRTISSRRAIFPSGSEA